MTWKQWLILVVALCILGGFAAIRMVGDEGSSTSPVASLSEPTMTRSINKTTAEPMEPTDVFTPDTPVIYFTVKLSGARPDTEVKARWIYVRGEAAMTNHLLNETSGIFGGTRYLSFSLTYDTDWPKGEYEVVLYLDGKEKLTVPFFVQ